MKQEERGQERCAVCGAPVRGERLCECCRESFALCDMEEYPRRKKWRAEICAPSRANAFK